MLVQTLNHILARFQNRRIAPARDPLARFDLNPLLPLRNLLWGFVEDEHGRLTVRRRAAEYEYEYGLPLIGRAVPPPAHAGGAARAVPRGVPHAAARGARLLQGARRQTVDADAFPLLSSLREVPPGARPGRAQPVRRDAVAARAEMLVDAVDPRPAARCASSSAAGR